MKTERHVPRKVVPRHWQQAKSDPLLTFPIPDWIPEAADPPNTPPVLKPQQYGTERTLNAPQTM